MLNRRKQDILKIVVREHVLTGMPVSSDAVTRKGLGISSATVRNEMLELEDETAMRLALDQRREEITPVVLELVKEMLGDMRTAGRKTVAGRLQKLYRLATQVAG